MATGEDARIFALERHVREFWQGHAVEPTTWEHAPLLDRVPGFATYRVAPRNAGEGWVHVTVGSSVHEERGGTEFFLMAPTGAQAHAETLAMVSHLHSFEEYRIGAGSVIDVGGPWTEGSRMDHLLVSPPYPYGPALEWAPAETGGARFLWLLPVHRSEAAFVAAESLDAFEEVLEAEGVNVLDTDRAPLV
ncbi:suppressor of fused domain protein [Nocardiopsis sp. CT-R113]|uniref:Suppressor of fused domain protein n=1 Tax=Nocardiopsis codii TaxID=3065942 RepID=A0ABU7KEG7_9ACTN|nr:suppressor of fused domain protein [Nocardiopsis sp. CT-R113]MEE2040628.1 suppressor of fused domain protein [Nocardiopsis sp. CT-R113]